MQIQEALKFLTDIATKSPTNLLNAFHNATHGTREEVTVNREAMESVITLLAKNSEVLRYIEHLAEDARHQYRCHGSSFEIITFSLFLGGFVGGIQFFMNGGIAAPPAPEISPGPKPSLPN